MISDTITRMTKVTDLVEFESLGKTDVQWADRLYSVVGQTPVEQLYDLRKANNPMTQQIMLDSNYNVDRQVEFYTRLYTKGQ